MILLPNATLLSLLKLREQLASLIIQHTARISDPSAKAKAQSTIYEGVLQSLNVRTRIPVSKSLIELIQNPQKTTHRIAHPKSQQELAFWARLKEEARRKVVSAGQESRRH